MVCYLCEKKKDEGWGYYCSQCRRVKHLLNLYGDRVYEVLEHVLVRTEDKQTYKINDTIKADIDAKQYSLRSKKTKDSVMVPKA